MEGIQPSLFPYSLYQNDSINELDHKFLPLLRDLATAYSIPFNLHQGINKKQLNLTNPTGEYTLFLCACLSGDDLLVSYLIYKGADVNQRVKGDFTPLHLINSTKIFTLLMDAGANLECECSDSDLSIQGQTPIFTAVQSNNLELVDLMIQRNANLLHLAKGQLSLLHFVTDIDVTLLLLRAGLDLKKLEDKKSYPIESTLYLAANKKNLDEVIHYFEIALILLNHGATITKTAADLLQKTLLLLNGKLDLKKLEKNKGLRLESILSHGVNKKDPAEVKHYIEIALVLLQNGASTTKRAVEILQILFLVFDERIDLKKLEEKNYFLLEDILFHAVNKTDRAEVMCYIEIALIFIKNGSTITKTAEEHKNFLFKKYQVFPHEECFTTWVKFINEFKKPHS